MRMTEERKQRSSGRGTGPQKQDANQLTFRIGGGGGGGGGGGDRVGRASGCPRLSRTFETALCTSSMIHPSIPVPLLSERACARGFYPQCRIFS